MSTNQHTILGQPIDEIPDRPRVDRWWSAEDFARHLSAEGIECHASPRFGGPPIISIAVVGMAANAVLQLTDGQREERML